MHRVVRLAALRHAAPRTLSGLPTRSTLALRRCAAVAGTPPPAVDVEAGDLGAINKSVIVLTPRTYAYLLSNTREAPALRACRDATAARRGAQMQVPPEQGALLALLVELMGATRVLEVGTFTVRTTRNMCVNMCACG